MNHGKKNKSMVNQMSHLSERMENNQSTYRLCLCSDGPNGLIKGVELQRRSSLIRVALMLSVLVGCSSTPAALQPTTASTCAAAISVRQQQALCSGRRCVQRHEKNELRTCIHSFTKHPQDHPSRYGQYDDFNLIKVLNVATSSPETTSHCKKKCKLHSRLRSHVWLSLSPAQPLAGESTSLNGLRLSRLLLYRYLYLSRPPCVTSHLASGLSMPKQYQDEPELPSAAVEHK
ncbi:uncharacterized protein V6R79_007343 [Siganus canaliculatus]